MLADADAEQAVERREHDLDRLPRGIAVRAVRRGDVATSQLRDGERPAHEPERLDEGRGPPTTTRSDDQRRRGAQDDCDERRAAGSIAARSRAGPPSAG